MPSASRFSAPRTSAAPAAKTNAMIVNQQLLGLDQTTPHDLIANGRTPYAKNFRLYSEGTDERRVSVATRKGSGDYISPLFTSSDTSVISNLGQADAELGVVLNWRAMPFTLTKAGRLTRVDLNLKRGTGIAPVVVEIYSDLNGPSEMIADTTIIGSSIKDIYAYVPARFIEAPLLKAGIKYWIVAHVQDDGKDGYQWASTTNNAMSLVSNAGVAGMQATTYGLNFRTYLTPDYHTKGAARFAQLNGINTTVVAYENAVYAINDLTQQATPLVTGLNPLATNYYFSVGDGKIFWVNGYDNLMAWDGTYPANATNLIANSSLDFGTDGWVQRSTANGGTIAKDSTVYHGGTSSLFVSASGIGPRGAGYTINVRKGKIYNYGYWIKAVAGDTITTQIGTQAQIATATGDWQYVSGTIRVTAQSQYFDVITSTGNFNVDEVSVLDTGVEQILNDNLPILKLFTFHKDRAWGIAANDPNKLVFSENPGNPAFDSSGTVATTAYEQWYYAWLSISFIYVPTPKSNDPVSGMTSFQDVLKIFTTTNKYDLSGTDRSSLVLRQSTGSKGAVNQNSIVTDENYVYFAASDGFYRHNGSVDEIISDYTSRKGGSIQADFDAIQFKSDITGVKWKRQIRWYYGKTGNRFNTDCALWHTVFEEWQHDTEVYVDRAINFFDSDDDGRLAEFSSFVPAIYDAEQDYNSLGRAIDFAYYMKAESFGAPAQKKRILKFFPLIQGPGHGFVVNIDMDVDFANSPLKNQIILTTEGAVWGEFNWGDGTLWGGDTTFSPVKLRYSGYGYYWQPRIYKKGANTPVFFFGVQYSYKAKRL